MREDRHTVTVEKNGASAVTRFLVEEEQRLRASDFWNCLTAASEIASLLIAEGRYPWIVRLRKMGTFKDHLFHFPLIPRISGPPRTWTTHYVCCCDKLAYEPLRGKPVPLEGYDRELFGEEIEMEVFVSSEDLPDYLSAKARGVDQV